MLRWKCREHVLVPDRPIVMGILNVTPDSFSDGGKHFERDGAVAHGLRMAEDGADIIDVGGESTRPGADGVSEAEELRRVVPVIEELSSRTTALISVDTMKATVAGRAIAAGAVIVNDVSALTHDADMAGVVRESGAGVVLMHMLGNPRTMQDSPEYDDVVACVRDYLGARIESLVEAGLDRECLAVDPGIGFGKTVRHNLQLLAGLDKLAALGRPIVVGLSRKSFLGKLTGCDAGERLAPSIAALACCVWDGVHVMRVHDVKESCAAIKVVAALKEERVR